MEVEIGNNARVPNPAGGGLIRATVAALGGPEDAVEVTTQGETAKRDVVIVWYEDGEWEGFVGRVPYHLLSPDES